MDSQASFVTKILVPRQRPQTLRRARLLDAMLQASGASLQLVRAPAGFGKTTLLVDLVHDADAYVCWLSLDSWDRDVSTFLHYLRLTVARQMRPESLGEKLPDTRSELAVITNLLVEADRPVWLVLDDFHALDAADEVISHVDYFIQRLPPNATLFIASRTEPSLRSLPRLRLDGRLLELAPDELAFSPEEIRRYYERTRGSVPTDRQLRAIQSLTRGWPAGVALIDEYPTTAERPAPTSRLAEYLAVEVVDRLPPRLQRFVRCTSVFETLEVEGCTAVVEETGVRELLSTLEKQNVPLVRVQSGGKRAYRLHPLFREYVRESLRQDDPALYQRLQRRAGDWCRPAGRMSEAIWHFAQAEDWDTVAQTIQLEAPDAYRHGRWQTITSWLELMPTGELTLRPQLRVWEARVLGRLGQADQALRVIEDCLASRGSLPLTAIAEFECLRSAALRMKGDVRAAIAAGRGAVQESLAANAPLETLAEARKQLALALFADGAFSESELELRGVLEIYEQRGNIEEAAIVNGSLGSALVSLGRLPEAILHLEKARQQWRKLHNDKELSWVLNNLGVARELSGQPELAAAHFMDSLSKAREAGYPRAEAYALVSLADIRRRLGEVGTAIEHYEEGLQLSAEIGDMTLGTHALTGLADAFRAQDEVSRAEALARQALRSAEERGSAFEQGLAHAALGRISRQQGNLQEAVEAFTAAAEMFQSVDAKKDLAEALYHLADAELPLRRRRSGLRGVLSRLPDLATEIGHDAFLAELVHASPEAARYGAGQKSVARFYRQLLRSQSPTPGIAFEARSLAPTLPAVEVRALGTFEVGIDRRPVLDLEWESEKGKELFLWLLAGKQVASRDETISALWPDAGGRRAISAFHSTLYRVRRALYQGCIVESGGKYRLNPQGTFTCDVMRFLELTADGQAAELSSLTTAVELYGGPFAPNVDSDWASTLRLQLADRFSTAANRAADELVKHGDPAAVPICEKIVDNDPYNEGAHHRLMLALVERGDLDRAIGVYRRYREVLEAELGEQPGPILSRLYEDIRARLRPA